VAILNYTTEVPASRTVGQLQEILAKAGARAILAEYDGAGRVVGLSFTIATVTGPQAFTLPVRPSRVHEVLQRQRVPPRYRTPEQAERVAWRIVKDWVEAQLAIIHTGMVGLDQVMLPYLRTADGTTLYERYQAHGVALLEAGNGEPAPDHGQAAP
jgi:hypothetical protein